MSAQLLLAWKIAHVDVLNSSAVMVAFSTHEKNVGLNVGEGVGSVVGGDVVDRPDGAGVNDGVPEGL